MNGYLKVWLWHETNCTTKNEHYVLVDIISEKVSKLNIKQK